LIAQGKTLLIASHNLNEISSLCNRIVLMENGKILDTGTSDAIQKYYTIAIPEYFSFDGGKHFHLKNREEITSTEEIRILNYGLADYAEEAEGISNKKAFRIFCEAEIPKAINGSFSVQVCDITGVIAFTSSTLQQKNISTTIEPGKYRIEFIVPADLLNEKMYAVNFRFVGEKKVLLKIDKLITLKISEGKENLIPVMMPGILKPVLESVLQKIQ